jgi:predicted lipoprotein with Yx(FWY)xxD motif
MPQAADTDRASGDYSVVTRDDGSKQWAYRGKPLYFWSKDAKPGDTTGDGVKGVWRVARP